MSYPWKKTTNRKQQQQKDAAHKQKKRRSQTFILEEIISPGVASCPVLPIDDSLSAIKGLELFTQEELVAAILENNSSIDLNNINTESLFEDYFGKIDEYLAENPTEFDAFDIEDLSTWPTLEALINSGQLNVEMPDIGGVVDTLPPPVTVPIDPPRNNHNKDDNDNTNYDFPLGNQPLVGVIDTGLGADNPDIDYGRVTLGYDRVGRDGNPLLRAGEGDEHGSHVLGIIGATRDNGVGIDGINDKAPLWVGRAIGSGQWARSLREFVDAAKRARQKNAVANLSLDLTQKNRDGSVTTRYKLTPEERKAIQYAQDNGVLIVAAAGNDGDVMSVLGQASQEFDNIITVGAADGENRASYSSYGNGLDILAPGGTTDNPVTSTVGDGLGTMAGTSVATARVTGAASLVWAANPSLNFSQVKEVLKATAQDLGATGWDQETGAGLLDLDQAVERAKVTRGLSYRPQKSLISNRWTIDRDVTAGERAVQNYRIAHPWGRRIYKGYLDQNNSYDQLKFTLNRPSYLQFSFPNTGGSAELYTASGRPRRLTKATTHHENRNILYSNAHLGPGNYYIKVNKGRRSNINYDLTMNFDAQSPNTIDGKYYLPRPVLAKKPSFKKPTPKPSKDLAKILQELAEAKARREREEARRKRERERKRREEQEKREAEANARKAIDLVKEKNSDWLGEVKRNGQGRKDVEFDWNTQLDNRVAAIKYFENGYIIWNGIHGVAYKEGSGLSRGQKAQPDPRQVRLHDWGLHNGRVEYGSYIGELERDDYYKFSVEKLDGFATNKHMLQFALRNNGHGDISSKDAQFQILDEKFNPIFLNTPWEPEKNTGKVGLTYLDSLPDGQIYYVRVKPEKDNLDYKVIMNLDSAGQDYSYPARNVGYLRGRQQFRDYIGNRGDTNGDYYKFYVDDKSFLRFSLGELEPGSKIKAEIVDGDNRVLPLDSFDGTYGDVTLEKGHYYLRLLPEGDTSTNYVLTTQMAEELGEYTGRHEFQNRDLWDDEAYYRFTVGEQGARDFHLKLKQREGFTNVELHRDVGSGIVNSELVRPDFSQGTPQGPKKLFFTGANSGNQNEDLYRRYDNLAPGRYIVKVNLDSDFDSSAKYDLAMNIDLAGNSLENARDLGDLSDKRVELEDFVGWNKGDPEDFYKFTTDNREIRLQFALRDITAGPHIDVLDENGNVIPLKEFDDGGGERYGNVVIPPHGTYYLRVKAPDDRDDSTNYKLVVNLTDDVGILLNGHKVDGDIYKVYKDDKIKGILKNPIRGVQHYNGSEYQIFEGGSIVSSSHGTFPLRGSIREYYVNTTGGLGGSLGPPTSGEYSSSTGLRQDFANGYITWNGSSYEGFDQNGVPLFGRGGGNSLLQQVGVDYFIKRPEFYTTGNIFWQSGWAPKGVGNSWRANSNGNCTWYAHGRIKELGGSVKALSTMTGDAGGWHKKVSHGSKIVNNPKPGDIAEFGGHVAVVEAVNPDGSIVVSESLWYPPSKHKGVLHQIKTYSKAKGSYPSHFIRVPGVSVSSTGDNNHSPEQPISKFHEAKNAAIERARGINIGDPVGEPKYASTGDGKGWFQEFLNSDGNKRLLALEDGKETALWVHGDNLREYLERGGPEGVLGFPTNEETPYTADNTKTKGVWQGFSGSSGKARIHNHPNPSFGSVATWGAIGSLYTDMGGANSELGVPTKAEWEDNDQGTIWAKFENGYIAHNKSTGETIAYPLKSHNGSTGDNSSGTNAGSSSGSNNSDDIAGDADQIFQELYKFFEDLENSEIFKFAENLNDTADNYKFGPLTAAAEQLIETPLKRFLKIGSDAWSSLPPYKHIESKTEQIANLARKKFGPHLAKAFKEMIKGMKSLSKSVSKEIYNSLKRNQQRKELLSAIQKIVKFDKSDLINSFKKANFKQAFSKMVKNFNNYSDDISKISKKVLSSPGMKKTFDSFAKNAKSFAKKTKGGPGPIKFIGYGFDLLQFSHGEDKLREICKIIGATVCSTFLSALISPSVVTGPSGILLTAILAFAGAWGGEWLGGLLYDNLLKPSFDNFKTTVADAFNNLAEKVQEPKTPNKVFGFLDVNKVFGIIDVNAEQQHAYDAATIWQEQFGSDESDLSDKSKEILASMGERSP